MINQNKDLGSFFIFAIVKQFTNEKISLLSKHTSCNINGMFLMKTVNISSFKQSWRLQIDLKKRSH